MDNPADSRFYQKYFSKQHDMLRKAVREFVRKEIAPFVDDWEEQGGFPRELYKKVGELGYSSVSYPEDVGGSGGDLFEEIVVNEEFMRGGSPGLVASLYSHGIALPPLIKYGTPEQKEKFVKPVVAGDRVAALAVTEPGGGSDVASLQTTAVPDKDCYIVNGSKTFITSAINADQITCAVRTGGDGAHGISLLVIEADTPGYSVSDKLKKTGWWTSDTGQIFFDDCRVPVENRIGEENKGFYYQMENFQSERLAMAVQSNMISRMCLEEAIKYAKKRTAFGKTLTGFQVTRHKIAEMATRVEASSEFTYRVAAMVNAGEYKVAEVSMAKNFACQVANRVTFDATQIFGGYGFIRGHLVERLYRDNRIYSIGGGTHEIMNEVISKMIL
ncbi:acyl-CoA dehydrogenase [Desulfosalsimonas propionicica]|uniref:Acyl-CoA dehydrogenase n=1 Tax=Desulfosalsimonas propionicica TaxID=332175 RepID=A0A7W0HJU8_9BACT|nr:acyl-CoA dehydrogenase family protein [Desulfosalsimonas propionicica]MBA2880473.1 acyl-CoA dehydrogenase [Desulfosalsimonas propionicica]